MQISRISPLHKSHLKQLEVIFTAKFASAKSTPDK
jgi:hypothetical protein